MSSSKKDFSKMSADELKSLLCASQMPENSRIIPNSDVELMVDALYNKIGKDAYDKWSREVEKNGR